MRDLKRVVERSDTPAGVWFDQISLTAILVSLVAFSVETLPALPRGTTADSVVSFGVAWPRQSGY